MAGQKNLANRINQRRKNAVANLQARLMGTDEELIKDAKRFRNVEVDMESNKKEIAQYKQYLKTVLENTKKKITN
jgi:hypothetical protein